MSILCAECGYSDVKKGPGYWGPSERADRQDVNWCRLGWKKTAWNDTCSVAVRDYDLRDNREVCAFCGMKIDRTKQMRD